MALSVWKKLIYGLGQFGLVLVSYGVLSSFSKFYVLQQGYGVPRFIVQGYVWGLFTVAGLVVAVGRVFDAGAGLFFGWVSDKSSLKMGRRTGFMALSCVPLGIFSILIFFPPSSTNFILNTIVIFFVSILFYFFLALYTTPYLALLSEIGSGTKDRLHLSVLMACATAFASLVGSHCLDSVDSLSQKMGCSKLIAFRCIITGFGLLAILCLALPAFFLKEKKYNDFEPVKDSLVESLKAVIGDSYFKHYLIADSMYRIASTFTITGFAYYITVLLGLPKSLITYYLMLIFFTNLILYVPVSFLTQKIGKRKILFFSFLLLMTFLIAASFAGRYPFESYAQGIVLSVLISIPLSIFTVVPNALIADLSVASRRKTGKQRGGMYFGVHSLVSKIGELVGFSLFPLILGIGKKTDILNQKNMFGLRLSLIIAAVFSLIGFLFLFGYREKEVRALLEKEI